MSKRSEEEAFVLFKKEYFNHLNQKEILATVSTSEICLERVYCLILTRSQYHSPSEKNNFLKFVCWSWTALKENKKVANKFSVLLRDSANTKYHYPNKP